MKRLNICFYRPCIALLLLLVLDFEAFAYDFWIDGVYYNYNSDNISVTVTSNNGYGSGYYNSVVEIPSSVTYKSKTYIVTGIGDYALSSNNITCVSLPNTIKAIGINAFSGSSIDSISIPNSVKSIGSCAFWCCANLKKLSISDSITSIENSTFYNCTQLTEIRIPEAVTYIGDQAFKKCSSLTSITIPDSVKYIGRSAFWDCSSLTHLIIPHSVNFIGQDAFNNCSGLNWIILLSASPLDLSDCTPEARDNMFPQNQLIYVVDPNKYIYYGWRNYNLKSIYQITPQITRSSINFNNPFEFKELSLFDSNGQHISTNLVQNNFFTLDNLEPKSNYKIKSTFLFEGYELEIEDSFKTNSISVGYRYSWQSKLTLSQITFYTSRDVGIDLESCGVESLSGINYIGNIKETTENYFKIESNITELAPGNNYKLRPWIMYNGEKIFGDVINIKTIPVTFDKYLLSSKSQTTLSLTFCVNRDDGFILEAYGVENSTNSCFGEIFDVSDDNYTITCIISGLIPNKSYEFRPWIQFNGEKYYGSYKAFQTSPVDVCNDVTVTPTSVYLSGSYSSGDANVTDAYFTFNGESKKTLYQTGLNPNTTYSYTYTVETTSGNQVNNYSFSTPALTMLAQPVKMLTNTTVLFEAETNMIDEESMVGFEWRRYDAPNEMPSTQVYSPVFDGKIAGTLRNLTDNVYYKYRPFYKSNSGESFYGNWVAFLTADADVEYEPMVYTYNSPAVTQTEATLQGVALRGSDEITEQGFEYWKSGNSNVIKVTATGERMSKKVSGLQSGAKYTFRAFLTAGGETRYGYEVEFVTLSNSLDVNLDGEINIADINAVIDIILTGASGLSGDVNGDGEVNIADINCIIDAILSH